MQNSLFLARLIGPVLLAVGVAILVNQRGFRDLAQEFMAGPALLFLPGLLLILAGLAIVLTHNVWTPDWRVVITVFGWLNLIGGVVRLCAPRWVEQTGRTMLRQTHFIPIAAAVWVALGLLLCFFGFRH
jgi:amino acid transporter